MWGYRSTIAAAVLAMSMGCGGADRVPSDEDEGLGGADGFGDNGQQTPAERTSEAGGMESRLMSLSEADRTFVQQASLSNQMEVALGNLAAEQASSDAVKQLGERIAADHEAAERDLQASLDAGDATTAIGERPEAVEGSAERLRVGQANDPGGTIANLRQEAEQLQQRLEGLSGAEFDRAYLEAMVKHHQRDIQQFERAAQEADGAQIRAFAEKTLPLLHTHLERSQQLQRQQTTR